MTSITPKPRGLGVTHLTWERARDAVRQHLVSFVPAQIVTLTPEMCVRASDDPAFRTIIDDSIVVADGIGVVWGHGRLTGARTEKIPGIDLAKWALEEVDRMAGRIYLLGAKPDIVAKAAENLAPLYPRLAISGFHDGYFDQSSEPGIVSAIASVSPHLLLVGMGSPKQDQFIWNHLPYLGCAVAIGIGGAFDVWSGSVKRAPAFFRKTGTEWLYRTLTQPRERFKRLSELGRFIALVNSQASSK